MKKTLVSLWSKWWRFYFGIRYGGYVVFGKEVILNGKFKFGGKGRLYIGDGCNLWAHSESNRFFTYDKDAVIRVGKNVRLNGVLMQCKKSIEVGDNCLIGSALMMDTDFHAVDPKRRREKGAEKVGAVKIGENVWIAGQTVILKGVTIGKDAVVGIRSVVTKSVEKGKVVAGNPAKVVGEV